MGKENEFNMLPAHYSWLVLLFACEVCFEFTFLNKERRKIRKSLANDK